MTAGEEDVLVLDRMIPAELREPAAWTQRQAASDYAEHARRAARETGARERLWITLEDPWDTAFATGLPPADSLAAAHHLCLAHGLAARALREELGRDLRLSVSLHLRVVHPADPERTEDLEAVHRVQLLTNHVFLGPLLDGSYPVELREATREASDWSFVRPGDLALIRQRVDVLTVDHRKVLRARAVPGATPGGPGPWWTVEDVELTPAGTDPAAGLEELLAALDNAYDGLPARVDR